MVACCRLLIGCALLATMASTLRVYPHQLAYFNEVAGGLANGHNHLLGSNIDWGQDVLLVREWLLKEGMHPADIRVISYSLLTERWAVLDEFITDQPTAFGHVKWEIVSPNRVYAAESAWKRQVEDGNSCRPLYTAWLLPGRFVATPRPDSSP